MLNLHQLRSIPILAELSEEELERLSQVTHMKKAKKGAYIIHKSDPGSDLMFVADGKAKVSIVSDEGKEVVIALFGRGDFFGEVSVITGEPRSADVVAMEDTVIYYLSSQDFHPHIEKFPGLSRELLRELALRVSASSSKIADLVLYDVYRRVARTLLRIAEPVQEGDKKIHQIEKRPTHQELAAMVGTSREMVTRALKGLEEDGCISTEGKLIKIFRLPL